MPDMGIRTPLTAADRARIVGETTSGNGFPHIRRLELSSLGGSLSVTAKWPDGFEWNHEVVLGRDQMVRVQLAGILYPFGHLASVLTVTKRGFPQDPPPSLSVAALSSTATLAINDPVRAGLPRPFPFQEVEILGRAFEIDPPVDNVFVPELNGQSLLFPIRCSAANGNVFFKTRLVFIANTPLTDLSTEGPIAATLWEPFSSIELPGVPINMVRSGPPRDGDIHEVHALKIAGLLNPNFDGFSPSLSEFKVELPALRALRCNFASEAVPVVLKFTKEFLTQVDIPDLPLEPVSADGVGIDFTDRPDRSGGLMAPKYTADKVSRTFGLIPQNALQNVGASPPDLSQIYDGATLLGLPLGQVLENNPPPGLPTIVPLTNPPGAKMIWENLLLKDFGSAQDQPGHQGHPLGREIGRKIRDYLPRRAIPTPRSSARGQGACDGDVRRAHFHPDRRAGARSQGRGAQNRLQQRAGAGADAP
jgi:hypothetical protein